MNNLRFSSLMSMASSATPMIRRRSPNACHKTTLLATGKIGAQGIAFRAVLLASTPPRSSRAGIAANTLRGLVATLRTRPPGWGSSDLLYRYARDLGKERLETHPDAMLNRTAGVVGQHLALLCLCAATDQTPLIFITRGVRL